MEKKTMVWGASPDPGRYSYLAVNRLQDAGVPVVALGEKDGSIGSVPIYAKHPDHIDDLHTITLYMNPRRQRQFYDYLIGLKPKRIIFNPGTENPELIQLARENGIQTVNDCTLVMLRLGVY